MTGTIPTTLSERIEERRDERLANRYVPPPQIEPAWLRRMREGKLPPKDMSGRAAA